MSKTFIVTIFVVLSLSLVSCQLPPAKDEVLSVQENSSSAVKMTDNVSYTGILSKKSSQNQTGTHQLTTKAGTTIYLTSQDQNLQLDVYLGKTVEVRGSAEPIGSVGLTLLHVQEITILEPATSSSSSLSPVMCGGIAGLLCATGYVCTDNLMDDCDPKNGGADCSGICVLVTSSSITSSSSLPASSAPSSASVIVSLASSSSAPRVPSASSLSSSVSSIAHSSSSESVVRVDSTLMAKQNYSTANLWSQKYCTSHIGFCVAAHKNWYFKSFGATTSSVWHVEFGMSEIDTLGSGVITVKLLPGTSTSVGGSNGSVLESSGEVVGFKDWYENQHFEISGPSNVRSAVEYMMQSILPYNPGE